MNFLYKSPRFNTLKNQKKASTYRLTGTGRDLYIIKQKFTSRKNPKKIDFNLNFTKVKKKKKFSTSPKIKRYETDGSGRDIYVFDKNGGAYKIDNLKFGKKNVFKENLRKKRFFGKENYFEKFSKKKKNFQVKIFKKQRILSSRLSVPKNRILLKKQNFLKKSNLFLKKNFFQKKNIPEKKKDTNVFKMRKCKSSYKINNCRNNKRLISPKMQNTLSQIFKL